MKARNYIRAVPRSILTAGLALSLVISSAGHTQDRTEGTSAGISAVVQDNAFLERVESFRGSIAIQVLQVFNPIVQESQISESDKESLKNMATEFLRALDRQLLQYKADYRSEFITLEKVDGAKERLMNAESDIKWAVEKTLNAMVQLLDTLADGKPVAKTKKYQDLIVEVTRRLDANERMSTTPMDLLKNLAPVKKGLVRTLCSVVTRLCMNQNVSKVLREIPESAFSRESLQDMKIEVVSKTGQVLPGLNLPNNAAVIFAMNHDHAILDLKSIQILAEKMGIDRNMVLTTTDAWPQAKFMKNHDPNIMYIQEKGLAQKVVQNMKDHKGARPIAFTIYPEGQLPFWGTQFPLYAKFGAFIIARKAAVALKAERPVYYIEVHSNFLKSITSEASVPLKLQVLEPQIVPTEPLTERDAWAEKTRFEFEERANTAEKRGLQYDLIERRKIPGTLINTTTQVKPYQVRSCEGMF
ncbi:hypothetical protein [Bdellovibrio sp. HCB2-146]|uniref:hypothetical protein n=1 Tax=Bdellovibrio sp. HCB2-146 TaxID=3394362 RepID=UPI0039BC4D93